MPRRSWFNSASLLRAVYSVLTVLLLNVHAEAVFAQNDQASNSPGKIDFNRDIRGILSNRCFTCHGPDNAERQADLRLDSREGAIADLGEYAAVVPGKPAASELIKRITSSDPDFVMPPPNKGEPLTKSEVELLTNWVKQGAGYAKHWAYQIPVRPELPKTSNKGWQRNAIDAFILSRLDREKLSPNPEADRAALIRRVTLDLTGLPPTLEQVDQFLADKSPNAYESLVDRLLEREAYGEHWARMWLDLARYADSAGYADDPARIIWAYRDYVIRSLNSNKPFDQFTIEQIAGDLLPNPSEDQLIATAFHRNTLTNSEGGTNDEEFRNVAIVDRVNTTMAVWMGTTMACAQCHTHKFDPITQAEYFKFFAFFNSTEDADRRDESPRLQIYTDEQKANRSAWESESMELEKLLMTPTPELLASQKKWEDRLRIAPEWTTSKPTEVASKSGAELTTQDDSSVKVAKQAKTDTYTVNLPVGSGPLTGIQLETFPGNNFVISRISAALIPADGSRLNGRYIRVSIPGKGKMLSLAEVQIFSGADNIALRGVAKQSSTGFSGPANLAIDGNTNGDYQVAKSTTHTAVSADPWWEVDLKLSLAIDRIQLWNRTDNKLHVRLANFVVQVLDENRDVAWEQQISESPNPSAEYALSSARGIPFGSAFADFSQAAFSPGDVLNNPDTKTKGWAVGGQPDRNHRLTLVPKKVFDVPEGSTIFVTIEQVSQHENHTLSHFRISTTSDGRVQEFAGIPDDKLAIVRIAEEKRADAQKQTLASYFVKDVAPELAKERQRFSTLKKELAVLKPATSVPVMKDLPADKHRVTKIQIRGNYQQTSDEVTEGVPAAFHPLPEGAAVNRLALANWLIDEQNPLTARVVANRYWDAIFGIGIVSTSEEFGSQGERPVHPELLDWLATELVANDWNIKHLVKLLVTSAAYRQSSKVTDELIAFDPQNRLLARGPRFRLSAEMIRDQALSVSGLLAHKLFGPPVRPLQPTQGVSAAFGSAIDWKTSEGVDKFRRGLYTTWRRSNPYPSMMAFDAVNREVCTVRRDRTNTPLQALVTLNDPVYIEAAQALARRIVAHEGSTADRVAFGFRMATARTPESFEQGRLVKLYDVGRSKYADNSEAAMAIATMPLGPVPEGMDVTDLAAWTVVSNVLLNLDEMFMKR
ncbi:MAG: DUF1553 domain-containing protein [Planctomycetales bacterium]|jgi:hypothetical protein